jgi:hypothetical protein
MVFTSPSATRHTKARSLAGRESSRPCFARDAANGASTDIQELPAPPILPWAHCGTEADGKVGDVRVGIGMRCIPACATTAASQGPRHGSVPGRGSNWINAILALLARVCGCTSTCCTGAARSHRRWVNWSRAGGSAGLFMTLLAAVMSSVVGVPPAALPACISSARYMLLQYTIPLISTSKATRALARCRAPSFASATEK